MAALTSPGVSVSVTNESFYVPAASPTVPLFILATAENKNQINGISPAIGTYEHSVVRTVTSLTQSLQLYGIPRFLQSVSGDAHHGDARNEYGLLALNKFLGVGARALVVRANVNLNDDRTSIVTKWGDAIDDASADLQALTTAFIAEYNTTNNYTALDVNYKTTVTRAELVALIDQVLLPVYSTSYNFSKTLFKTDFISNKNAALGGGAALPIYNSLFTSTVGSFMGVIGSAMDWEANSLGSTVGKLSQWTALEAATFLIDCAEDYAYTTQFVNYTSLGANDAARRSAIVTALQAATYLPELRSEMNEFNIIVCPGYYEVADELAALQVDTLEESIVIAATPMNKDPDTIVTWATSSSLGRTYSQGVAYYYGHDYTSNIDGTQVLGCSSGMAARVYAYNDNAADVWWAPAGAQRGLVTGTSQVGYYTGVAGTATTFVEAALNLGQRDNLYKDGTNLNPITFIPGRGILVMGQKTSAPVTSALDRVNVIRLLAYIRRALRKSAFAFLFQPNDALTQADLKAMVDGFLGGIVARRGLYDFATQCDAANNTPDRIDRSELWIDIALKPVKAVEFIYIPIRVVNTGADI